MYCSHCGKQMDPAARFCPACGAVIAAGGGWPRAFPGTADPASLSPDDCRRVRRICAALWLGPLAVRVVTALIIVFTGVGLFAYLAAWIIIPEAPLRAARGRWCCAGTERPKRWPDRLNTRAGNRKSKQEPTVAPRPFYYRGRTLRCDGMSLDALAEAHGTPLYVYSAGRFGTGSGFSRRRLRDGRLRLAMR